MSLAGMGFDSKDDFAPPAILHLAGASPLTLGVGYLFKFAPVLCSHHSSTYCLAGASLFLDVG